MTTIDKKTFSVNITVLITLIAGVMGAMAYFLNIEKTIALMQQQIELKADREDMKVIETKLISIESLLQDVKSRIE